MIIECKNLTKKYDEGTIVLEDINFSVNAGEYIYIVGPNGGGKSTFIRILLGIIKKSSGEFHVNTEKVGYLPQMVNAKRDFPITVSEVIQTGFNNKTMWLTKEQKEKINQLLESMEISHLKKYPIGRLSGGELQRVYFIRMLINEPEVLFLDEPMSAIDPDFRDKMEKIILDYQKEHNATIIHITHDLDESEGKNVYYIDRHLRRLE